MEATLEREKPKFTLGNKVPNSFEELNAMTKNRYANVNTETGTNDATLRFARSMNLPKFTSTVKKPCPEAEKEKYPGPSCNSYSLTFYCFLPSLIPSREFKTPPAARTSCGRGYIMSYCYCLSLCLSGYYLRSLARPSMKPAPSISEP